MNELFLIIILLNVIKNDNEIEEEMFVDESV